MLPSIGDKVSVKVRDTHPDKNVTFFGPEHFTITGEVVPNFKWLGQDYICVRRDNSTFVSSIPIKNIVLVNDYVPVKTKSINTAGYYKVKSLKSNSVYTVTREGGNFTCECKGFTYRHDCKHVQLIKRITNA